MESLTATDKGICASNSKVMEDSDGVKVTEKYLGELIRVKKELEQLQGENREKDTTIMTLQGYKDALDKAKAEIPEATQQGYTKGVKAMEDEVKTMEDRITKELTIKLETKAAQLKSEEDALKARNGIWDQRAEKVKAREAELLERETNLKRDELDKLRLESKLKDENAAKERKKQLEDELNKMNANTNKAWDEIKKALKVSDERVKALQGDMAYEIVKAGYNTLAKKYHPDNGTDKDVAKMKELNLAWNVLKQIVRQG